MTATISPPLTEKRQAGRYGWLWWLALFVVVTLLWCVSYNRWTAHAWGTPVSYEGDAWAQLSTAKAYATGDVLPILPKYPASLGAPFTANWNDYPSIEEAIFVWCALFMRIFGIFTGSNLVLLSAHLLAAGSFYFVCRELHYERTISLVASVLFSMCRFAFHSGLAHLVLTFYWHVPLGLLVVWWCVSGQAHADRRKRFISIVTAVIFAIQYLYYTGIFLQLLCLAALICLIRRTGRIQVLFPLILVGVVALTICLLCVDTLYNAFVHGPNPAAVVRHYSGLEVYALKPVELFLPANHRLRWLENLSAGYYSQTLFQGENTSSYLGLVAIAALVWLGWDSIRKMARRDPAGLPSHAWVIGWVLLYSIVGGLNGLLGVFGIVIFRGTSRYSVVILALALLFLVREFSRLTRRWSFGATAATAGLIFLVGLWDQIPTPQRSAEIKRVTKEIDSDRRVAVSLESKLPPKAMIFQMPAVDYPEIPTVVAMRDYEHFRPYLHSRSLRFSYGSQKGRTREQWKSDLLRFGPGPAARLLEKYGFAAILINKRGYADAAASLVADLRAAGYTRVLVESDYLISFALQPSKHPLPPPAFDRNWQGIEGDATNHWRWSTGDATIVLYNEERTLRKVRISFGLGSVRPSRVEITYPGSQQTYTRTLDPARLIEADFGLVLQPGQNVISFRTDRPVQSAGVGDSRKLAFRLHNFTMTN